MYQGIFIDAIEKDKHLADLMSTKGRYGLQFTFQKPSEFLTLTQNLVDHQPDLLALDYRLNNRSGKLGYTAGALAQQLRELATDSIALDFPIVLLSSQDDLKAFCNNLTAHNLFDLSLTKEQLPDDTRLSQKMLSLVKGYKYLIKNWHKPERWSHILGLKTAERLRIAYQAIRELDKLQAPHQVARDILRYVINRPGILLDKDNVLAELGIAKTGKDIESLLEILQTDKVMYTGIFAEGWTRWWEHRLEEWGKGISDEHLGNLTAKQRVSCLNSKLGLKLSPAKSRWKKSTDTLVSFACASCHQPTEEEFSVVAYDPLPYPYSFVHNKYICFSCIQTGEFVRQGMEVDDDEKSLVESIQNGERQK
ncbi:MAG: hypothetical protein DRR16_28440 [Candidatus Parabeggiatoa sp. nov. 3]|nr:MAG: hypothetical protein DRR00_09845 [Gammaproteobacteria bacterium]RKZ56262.1 MAG: hypothetical protein DRQ99_28795 [Gammaproteobacteria bacterium]RKZ78066.1 MAG: hypothetical protein DRR16_28440 [Gammaproteobacteria bacterium]HEW97870.1 hypothetical protein [Beggiatoa sp.]